MTASYYIEIDGDDERLVAGDIIDLIQHYYHVGAAISAPLEVKVTIRDIFGGTRAYAYAWHPMQRLELQTGATRSDVDGVRAVVEIGPLR